MNKASKRSMDIFRARMLVSEPVAQAQRAVDREGRPYGAYHRVETRRGLPDALIGPGRHDYHYRGTGQSDHRLDAQWLADLPPGAPEKGW